MDAQPNTPSADTQPAKIQLAQGTLYVKGEFFGNIRKVEAKNITIGIVRYAQYSKAIRVTFTPVGKRKPRQFVETYRPSLVVLDGFGHIDPSEPFTAPVSENGLEISRSQYSSFDDRWRSDFDSALAQYVAKSGAKIAADFRGFKTA